MNKLEQAKPDIWMNQKSSLRIGGIYEAKRLNNVHILFVKNFEGTFTEQICKHAKKLHNNKELPHIKYALHQKNNLFESVNKSTWKVKRENSSSLWNFTTK